MRLSFEFANVFVLKGTELLSAVMKLQAQQDEMVKTIQKDINKRLNQNARNVEATMKRFEQQQSKFLFLNFTSGFTFHLVRRLYMSMYARCISFFKYTAPHVTR